jgi:hypothetical protein
MTMKRRDFLFSTAALALASRTELRADTPSPEHQLQKEGAHHLSVRVDFQN